MAHSSRGSFHHSEQDLAAKEENRVAGARGWLHTLPLQPRNRKRSMTFLTSWGASVQTHMPAGDIGHPNCNTAKWNQKTWVWLGLEEVAGLGARRLQGQKRDVTMKWQGSLGHQDRPPRGQQLSRLRHVSRSQRGKRRNE